MYYGRLVSRKVVIGDQEVIVDSLLEERVLRYLEENGFRGLWEKSNIGLNVGKHNYTPDAELSIQLEGMTHRALLEIKPSVNFLSAYIWKRMVGVAKYYHTQILLLYADRENSWYRIDYKTGQLTQCELPTPGKIPIKKLYRPFNVPATQVYNHYYKKAAGPALAKGLLGFAAELAKAPFIAPKKSRRRTKRKRRS